MIYFISWGLGVNSTSLIAAHILGLLDIPKKDIRIVFCDSGVETADTYKYFTECSATLAGMGYDVRTLSPKTTPLYYRPHIRGLYLDELLISKRWIPYPRRRLCSYEYKQVPMIRFMKDYTRGEAFYKRYCRHLLSIAADEQHRAIKRKSSFIKYPLIELGIDRTKGIELISRAGLPPAHKTGCFLCPLTPAEALYDLLSKHPYYINRIREIEHAANQDKARKPKYFFRNRPIDTYYDKLTIKFRNTRGANQPEINNIRATNISTNNKS